jgi:hypothetical protein
VSGRPLPSTRAYSRVGVGSSRGGCCIRTRSRRRGVSSNDSMYKFPEMGAGMCRVSPGS